jgi:hypothetical protein
MFSISILRTSANCSISLSDYYFARNTNSFGTPVEYDAKDITQVLRHEDTKARRIIGTDFADYTDYKHWNNGIVE